MKARAGTGWAYVMTDLSLILFMITAAALSEAPRDPAPAAALPALGEPVAVWRGGDGVALRAWLAASGQDSRLRLTVVGSAGASHAALALAQAAGRPARVVLEPDGTGAPYAALTYDQALAQPLQPGWPDHGARTP